MTPNKTTIACISSNEHYTEGLRTILTGAGFHPSFHPLTRSLLGEFYGDPPNLLLIDLGSNADLAYSVISCLRNDCYFSTIPVIGILSRDLLSTINWESCPADDFITTPFTPIEVLSRVELALFRIRRIFDNNPLTRLPGNTSIQEAIKHAIGRPLAVCHVDINHFKPYNDVYGFSHGDKILRMLARIVFNAVRDLGGGFSGHIGGDDFVFIAPMDRVEQVAQTIIEHFDHIVLDLFDDQTKAQGYYIAHGRKGVVEKTPLLSLAIAIVPVEAKRSLHVAQIAQVAADLKKQAKNNDKSSYMIDKRNS